MSEEQFAVLLDAVNRGFGQLTNVISIMAATITMGKTEMVGDAGAQATLEMLCDYYSQSAKGEPMKPIPRMDLEPGKKA